MPRSSPSPKHARPGVAFGHRRVRIVQAARDAFLEHGFESVSMDRVATAAGLTKKTLYNHFPGKASLFAAVIDLMCEEVSGTLHEPPPHPDDLVPELERFCHRFVSLMVVAPGLEVLRLAITTNKRFPEFGHSLYMAASANFIAALTDHIERHNPSPSIADPVQLARQLIGACLFLIQSALLGADIDPDSTETRHYLRDTINALVAGARRHPAGRAK